MKDHTGLHYNDHYCAYCGDSFRRTPVTGMAWTDGETFHWECYLERFADCICELLQIVAEACKLFEDEPLQMAAE